MSKWEKIAKNLRFKTNEWQFLSVNEITGPFFVSNCQVSTTCGLLSQTKQKMLRQMRIDVSFLLVLVMEQTRTWSGSVQYFLKFGSSMFGFGRKVQGLGGL